MAARLVDAQAPGARLGSAPAGLGRPGTPDRLLTELGLIRLLVRGYQRGRRAAGRPGRHGARPGRLPGRHRVDVLAGAPVRDDWAVLGRARRGRRAADGAPGLAARRRHRPPGAGAVVRRGRPDRSPPTWCRAPRVDADLCFYPGAQPLRALVAERHGDPRRWRPGRRTADRSAGALDGYARRGRRRAVARAVAGAARRGHARRPITVDGGICATGPATRCRSTRPRRAVAAGRGGRRGDRDGGRRVVTPAGLRPLTAWTDARLVRL